MFVPLVASGNSRAIIFDLDGTLVDSSPGILASLDHALQAQGVSPTYPLNSALIGPPLLEIVTYLCPDLNSAQRDQIVEQFKRHYDSNGYLMTSPFIGVEQMLAHLIREGVSLSIATNKRHAPTRRILSYLNWDDLFQYVYCPDSVSPPVAGKAELIARLCLAADWMPTQCLYVGDRMEDMYSAHANNIRFAYAQWGFGNFSQGTKSPFLCLESPSASSLLSCF
jgi:phosphoglycolate phosphatase